MKPAHSKTSGIVSSNWKNFQALMNKKDQLQLPNNTEKKENGPELKQSIKSGIIYNDMNKGSKQIAKHEKSSKKRVMNAGLIIEEQKKQMAEYKRPNKKRKVKSKKLDEVWFDNVDPILLGEEYVEEEEAAETEATPGKEELVRGTKAVALDCEMVGIGIEGKESMLARVSIVNEFCKMIYDKYVKPQEPVVDYRTEFSGIRPEDIEFGEDFKVVQEEVAQIIEGKILVGHGLVNDLRVLNLSHPRTRIRDTVRYKPFKTMFRGHTPKLKMLAKKILGADIQTGEHDSVQDAQAVMRIYTLFKKEWDKAKRKVFDKPKNKVTEKS